MSGSFRSCPLWKIRRILTDIGYDGMKGRHIERLPLEESEFDGAEAVHEVELDDVARVPMKR